MEKNYFVTRIVKRNSKTQEGKINHFLQTIAFVNGKEYLISTSFVDDKLLLICELAQIEIIDKTNQ